MTRLLKALLAPLGLFLCLNSFAGTVTYNGVDYTTTVTACTLASGVCRTNINAYDRSIQPVHNGREIALATGASKYPSASQWAQFQAWADDGANSIRMMHVKDTSPDYRQEWGISSSSSTAPCINGEFCGFVTQRDPSPSDVDIVEIAGTVDWHVAAKYYLDWAQQQTWYASHGALAGEVLGHVMSCSTNAYTLYNSTLDLIPPFFGTKKVGCFMTQYREQTFDELYPDYTCSAAGNCAAWLQNMKDSGNTIGLPYINGALWASDHGDYNSAEMCLDSGGTPEDYSATAGNDLKYVDPLLATWPDTIREQFDAIQATDESTSEGVYIDVSTATEPPVCYYDSVANHAAYITGVKAVLTEFKDKVIMAERPAEIYLPYIDIAYIFQGTNITGGIGMYAFIYGGVPDLYIVGKAGLSTDGEAQIYRHQYEARNTYGHDALLLQGGINVCILLPGPASPFWDLGCTSSRSPCARC